MGDDDQSIYGFRGSRPELMFEVKEYYKNAKEILLTNNYRSTKEIVDMAGNLISHNHTRFDKDIVAVGEDGNSPDIRIFKSQKEEIEATCLMAKEYIKNGVNADDIAVLVRNNLFIPDIKSVFESMDVSTYSKKKTDPVYSSMVSKDVMSYLKCASTWNNGTCDDQDAFMPF